MKMYHRAQTINKVTSNETCHQSLISLISARLYEIVLNNKPKTIIWGHCEMQIQITSIKPLAAPIT